MNSSSRSPVESGTRLMVSRKLTAQHPGVPRGRGRARRGAHTARVELWFSRLVQTGLVAASLIEPGAHPARRGGMPRSARVIDEPTAEIAGQLLGEQASAAAAAGVPLRSTSTRCWPRCPRRRPLSPRHASPT